MNNKKKQDQYRKHKILIIDHRMNLGGIAIAMINMIANLKDEYDIEFLIINRGGELESRLPKDVKIHYLEGKLTLCNYTKKTIFKAPVKDMLTRLFYEAVCRIFPNRIIMKHIAMLEKDFGEFDIIINNNMDFRRGAFCGPCHNYAIHKAKGKKKFIIIHGDFIENKYNTKFSIEEYGKYDKILCVSEALASQVKAEAPHLFSKVDFLYNFQDIDGIKNLSKEKQVTFNAEKINIISVSRLTKVKGYLRSLKVFKKLMDEGYEFCWHILGSGEQRKDIEKYIAKNNMQSFVKLYGALPNPYPYIAAADLMYLGSYHESYGLVLIEAMILGVPSISTDVLPAKELLEKHGLICENSENGIYNHFKMILNDTKQLKKHKENLVNYTYDNESIKTKFRKLINE